MQENNMDELRERFIKMCPDVITTISDMIGNPETPGSVKVQLIAIVLDRALGKPETPVKVTANAESFEEAEIELRYMSYEGYPPYPQLYGEFDPYVSVVDLLFMTGKDAPSYMLFPGSTL